MEKECQSIDLEIYGYASGGIAGSNGCTDQRCQYKYNKNVGYIERCYTSGYIGNQQAAAIACSNGVYGGKGYIYDCYSNAEISDNEFSGSIISAQSYQGQGGYLYNSYYLNTKCSFNSPVTTSFYGTVENSYSNKTDITASILNNGREEIWVDDANKGYPVLKWQNENK